MKNLKVRFTVNYSTTIQNAKCITYDSSGVNKDIIYICTDEQLFSYNLKTETLDLITDVIGAVSCEYLSLENQICVATAAGDVLLINPETKTSNDVSFCDAGIEKMVWSPSQEVVAFVTASHNLVVMTFTFEPVSEVMLDDDHLGGNEFINVGWGKKETQFHGTEGKTAAKQTTDFIVPDNIKELPQSVDITWREDGAYFAVTFVGKYGRMFKVFNKEGTLEFTSEKLNDLWPAIAWRPSGTWIAVPHKFPNKSTIALFEKNGLRHREIVLPFQFDDEPVVNLKWSVDSDVLAVETVVEGKSTLYLYTMANYHWYLKQTLCFDSVLCSFMWESRIGEGKILCAILPNGTLARYSWTFDFDQVTYYNSDTNQVAMVAVIDGKRLLITDFCKGVIPPPMSTFELLSNEYINECAFRNEPITNSGPSFIVIYDAKNNCRLYKINENHSIKPSIDIDIEPCPVPLGHYSFNWQHSQKLYWVQSIGIKSRINTFETSYGKNYISNVFDETMYCISAVNGDDTKEVIITSSSDGKLNAVSNHHDSSKIVKQWDHGQICNKIDWWKPSNKIFAVSLDIHQCLRLSSLMISSDVTSFYVTFNYLVFTQLTVMKFVQIIGEEDWKVVDERKIERGAKIVTILPDKSMVILQLPRGNLEAISPRVFSIEKVGKLLVHESYDQAMKMLRQQRINLNIICDHNIDRFCSNLHLFVSVVDPQWLNLFINDLQNENVTLTMYSSNYFQCVPKYPKGFEIENKVEYICNRLREQMSKNFNRNILPIITTHVKTGNIEEALKIIFDGQNKKNSFDTDGALKYLLYLVDVNQLYDVALGMYDFGFVLLVAEKSQKDPREFLPFLNELKVLEENYRKFKIDCHLKKFTKALGHISNCGEEKLEEALEVVRTHKLYKEALSAYEGNDVCYKKISHAYADYLRESGKFENASIMYERCDEFTQAVACARHTLDWQRCLALTKLQGTNPQAVALSLVPSLMEHGRHEDAFELLKKYGNNFCEGISCLLDGKLYLRAIYEARMEDTNLLGSIITPHLLHYIDNLEDSLVADRSTFLDQKSRLLTIREGKANKKLDDGNQSDESELFSDTTSLRSSNNSASSRGTNKTFRSSKNRRKHERKLLSLKEGNPFEDIALIDSLYNHIMKVFGQQAHIRDTCKALLHLCEDNHAKDLQKEYRALLILLKDSAHEIWTPEIRTTAEYVTGPNIDYAALQNEQRYSMINPLKRFKPDPVILDWQHEILR